MTFQTANIPLTQGYKVGLRQLGFGLNVYDGPLTIFLTTNFADMYSPIAVTLMDGAGEPLGRGDINLLRTAHANFAGDAPLLGQAPLHIRAPL